jgi:hypothetical protein
MMRRAGLLAFVFLVMSSLASAQHNCPQRFRYAGTLSGTGSVVSEFNERIEINLPEDATIDTTYQQANVRSQGGSVKPRAGSLVAKDIPKGILIIPYGSTDLEKGWSVSAPKLVGITAPSSQSVTRYKFGMKLYCTVGSSVSQNVGGCSVGVDVCYLPKK